tara:strand:- start:960 stop:2687 length:1728 start_codon:yes stop_codon:yes gene_type:complete
MAISDSSITNVELVNTFEQWRLKTNQIVTVLNENSDEDPTSRLISANSLGGLEINTISANIVTGANVTGSRLLFSGGTIDFTGATITDLGTAEKFALVESAGATISGSSPDSKIERSQINECEVNLNGANFNANGASTINLSGATVSDLGTVSLVTLNGGTINDVNVNITDADSIVTITSAGPHIFTGASFANGTFNNTYTIGGFTHSANISVNTASAMVSNVGPIFGTDITNANVAIGNFPEYTSAPTLATSSKGRLHIRTAFANSGSSATAVGVVSDELILENTQNVGMTLLSSNTSNAHIAFGDSADPDVGGVVYNHATDSMHIVTGGANTVEFGDEYGGYMQIAGGDTLGTQAGKLHINVGSSDSTTGIYLESHCPTSNGIEIDAKQTTANVIDITANSFTTGHVLSIGRSRGVGDSDDANGALIHLTDGNSSTNVRAVIDVVQNRSGATGSMGIRIETDGGTGLSVIQNKTTKPGVNVWTSAAHTVPLAEYVSTSASATGTSLLVKKSGVVAGDTHIFTCANSSLDVFATYANGSIWTGAHGGFLTTQHPTTSIFLLGVRDTGGTIVNTN